MMTLGFTTVARQCHSQCLPDFYPIFTSFIHVSFHMTEFLPVDARGRCVYESPPIVLLCDLSLAPGETVICKYLLKQQHQYASALHVSSCRLSPPFPCQILLQ